MVPLSDAKCLQHQHQDLQALAACSGHWHACQLGACSGLQAAHSAVQNAHGALQVAPNALQVAHSALRVAHDPLHAALGALQVAHSALQVAHDALLVGHGLMCKGLCHLPAEPAHSGLHPRSLAAVVDAAGLAEQHNSGRVESVRAQLSR